MPRLRPFRALRPISPTAFADTWQSVLQTEMEPVAALRWGQANGALVKEPEPAFFVVEMQAVAALASERLPPVRFLFGLSDPESVLDPLEEGSRNDWPKVAAMPGLAADDHQVFKSILSEVVTQSPPEHEGRFRGQLVRVWPVRSPPLQSKIERAVEELPVRVLGDPRGESERLLAIAPLADPGLGVLPIHRAIQGVPTFREDTFLTLAQGYARVYELDQALTTSIGRTRALEKLAVLATGYHAVLWILAQGRGRILRFRQALGLTQVRAAPKNPTLRSLDLALLNALVLRTVLGIRGPEVPDREQVFPVSSLEELVDGVDRGVFQTGFALNPPPWWEIRAVIEAAQRLPNRTLLLDPMPPAGLLFLSPKD